MSFSEALAEASKGNTRAAEEVLMVCLDDPQASVADWPEVIAQLVKARGTGSAETLAWATLDAIQMRLPPQEAVVQCGRILRLFSKNDEFRSRAVELYEQAFEPSHLDPARLDRLIEISGLRGGKPIRRAMQTLDLCLGIQVGDYLISKEDGPPVEVVEVDQESWNIHIETPAGTELFDPVTLGDQYEPAKKDDFRVLQQFAPDEFKRLLVSDPSRIVLTMVRAHEDVITSDQLEQMLSPRYLSRGEWAGWWTKARLALKKHPNIALDGRNPIVITYEEDARAVEDQVWSRFDVHACPKTWLELAKKYLQECKIREQEHQPEFLLRLADAILREAGTLEQRADDRTLSAYLTADAVRQLAGETADDSGAVRILEQTECASDAFLTLPGESYWAMALACLKRIRKENWPAAFVDLIPIAAPSRCDELAREIRGAGRGELLGGVVRKVLADPLANVNGLCWLYLGPKDSTGLDIPPLTTLVSRIMGVLDQFTQSSAIPAEVARDVRSRIRSTLSAKKCSRFKECLEQIDVGMADALRTQLQRDHGLSEAVRNDLLNCIRRRFPALWHKPKKKPWEDERTLYCTQDGYTAKEAELKELIDVKLRENAIAIGAAAERGDLSENSEYKFALEERDLLRARIAEIRNQMARSQVLHRDEVTLDHVSIGTKVELKHIQSGGRIAITFLGPWESDLDRNILNYQAPISQRMMGLKIGESADFEFKGMQGEFEVVLIDGGVS